MAINAVTPTIPVSNDIIAGEFKAYANWGLPSQTLLGATRDGAKVDTLRTIKELGFDGAYGPNLDTDGVPLVRYTRLMGVITLQNLYLKYFNKKNISDCESTGNWESGNWGGDGGTYAAETTIVNSGSQSAKCSIATTSTGHGIHEVFSSSKDLTVFDNSEVSGDSDYIGFAVYITTAMLAILGTDSIDIRMHMDSEGVETNYYTYSVEATALTADQWNTFKIAKSAFTEVGTGDWSAVSGMSAEVPDETDDALEFYIDSIGLIQNQSDSAIVPVNGSVFDYTDEGDYKRYTPDLNISDSDYLENINLIGCKLDGKKIRIQLLNAFNDGNLSLAFESMEEVVNETQFSGHWKDGNFACPIEFFEYVA